MGKVTELSEERREQIIVVALQEFAEKGYEQTSTNIICKKAGVSKGLLFHYFDSKKGLYLYVLDRCIDKYKLIIERIMPELSEDIVERISQIMKMKMKIFAEDPLTYSMVFEAFFDIPEDLTEEIKTRYSSFHDENMFKIYSGLDFGVFRPEIDHQKALELIFLVTDGLTDRYIKTYTATKDRSVFNLEQISLELMIYMEMLKKGIYKETQIKGDKKND